MKRLLLFLAVIFFPLNLSAAETAVFSPAPPAKQYFKGEKFQYKIYYLGIAVGESVSEIKEIIQVRGRSAYHIEVKVHSYRAIDLIYKVRDEHHSYVDTETLVSLGYEKRLQEGLRKVYERMELDPEKRMARYYDEKGVLLDEIPIEPDSQDALSCGYWARTQILAEKTSFFIPVHADKRNWNLEVKVGSAAPVDIPSVGKFQAVTIEPLMEFQGIFIRKGKTEGRVSLDERRIPLTMKVKIPVLGNIYAELFRYESGSPNQNKL